MDIWYQLELRGRTAGHEPKLQALKRAGVSLRLGPNGAKGPGLFFLDQITEEIHSLLRELTAQGVGRVLAVALNTASLHHEDAWGLLAAGASDVLAWEASEDAVREVLVRIERWQAIDALVESPLVQENLVGRSRAWVSALRQVIETARFTDASVLLIGETGTGKELAARLVHTLDARADKKELVVVDCTTVVPELSGSEFFGHERGAFTGAVTGRDGAFALANGGTLFLDEVSELPLNLQAQLLRVIQEGTFKGNTWQRTRFRLVCATNRDLLEQVQRGEFRRDLYYRIATVSCHLPPLRERPDDILPLARHFLKLASSNGHGRPPDLDGPVRAWLHQLAFPGNVRELKQLITRMAYRHVGEGPITVGDTPEPDRPSGDGEPVGGLDGSIEGAIRQAVYMGAGLKGIRDLVTEAAIRIALEDEGGNLQKAARRLGVTPRALQIRRASRREHDRELTANARP